MPIHPSHNARRPSAPQGAERAPSGTISLATLLADPAVWSLTYLTHGIGNAERWQLFQSFADFAARRGLQVHVRMGRTFVVPTRGPITTDDRGALLAWLCARPEVHFVQVLRRPPDKRSCVIVMGSRLPGTGGIPGKACDPLNAVDVESRFVEDMTDPDRSPSGAAGERFA